MLTKTSDEARIALSEEEITIEDELNKLITETVRNDPKIEEIKKKKN